MAGAVRQTGRAEARGGRIGRKTTVRRGFYALLAAFACAWGGGGGDAALAQTVKNIHARQRWPWNNLVDIDYTITGVEDPAGLYIRFRAENPMTGREVEARTLDPEPVLTNGTHRVTWDPAADGACFQAAGIVCRAALMRDDPDRYLVVDLSKGTKATAEDPYPISRRPAPPPGGWTDEYKTNCLVLRKIDPGTFWMGSKSGESGHDAQREDYHEVTLTSAFYIGVFQVTQKQYELVTGNNPSANKGPCRPAVSVSYNDIRGKDKGAGWPSNAFVDAESFLGKLRSRTQKDGFDLPTEAQWEYACRAGTETPYNGGPSVMMSDLGRYNGNAGDGRGGFGTHTSVGCYLPNAWGLYDMHGNVWEWCLDWYTDHLGTNSVVNPPGEAPGTTHTVRGGAHNYNANVCRSACRRAFNPGYVDHDAGFRLAFRVGPAGQ